MNVQTDPLQSITLALRTIIVPLGVKNVDLGWPDSKFFQADGNLPSLAVFDVSDSGKHLASRETVHAVVNNADGVTATVYKEQLRKFYLLQLSLFTYTAEDRSNIGWMIEQYLTTNPRLQIGTLGLDKNGNPIETAVFKYRGQHNPPGESRFYQRDIMYEVTARVLDATSGLYRAKTITLNDNT